MRIAFYVLGQKGYASLRAFVTAFGAGAVAYVVGARDQGVDNDWYGEIQDLCKTNQIELRERGTAHSGSADFGFAIGWRWLIKDCANLVVFHDSLLPKYRGFAPLVAMLIDGAEEIGVTALIASSDYDRGDIVDQQSVAIEYPIKIAEAISKLIPLYTALVLRTAQELFSNGRLAGKPQDERLASYSLWRDEKDYFIDWSEDAARIRRLVDALASPYRGAASYLNGEIVRILEVEPVEDVVVENRSAALGKTIFVIGERPVVVCGRGLLKIVDFRSQTGTSLAGSIPFRSRFENRK